LCLRSLSPSKVPDEAIRENVKGFLRRNDPEAAARAGSLNLFMRKGFFPRVFFPRFN
jgi:hypothetical protein